MSSPVGPEDCEVRVSRCEAAFKPLGFGLILASRTILRFKKSIGTDDSGANIVAHILVTGCAGFIGFHLSHKLLEQGNQVTGLDNLNDYYDVGLKRDRLSVLETHESFQFRLLDVSDQEGIASLFQQEPFEYVVHLAAQAGVRYSLVNPHAYVTSNLVGFINILEGCRNFDVRHLLYASSSSVYGANTTQPFSTRDPVSHPLSLYAATKKANEVMAHSYSHLFGLPTTGLRFFTVYGPWGRPDMAMFKFARAIDSGQPLQLFNEGQMERDFTYVDDAVECVVRLIEKVPSPDPDWSGESPDPSSSAAPFRVHNVGTHQPVKLLDLIPLMEELLGREAQRELLPMQPGDVHSTIAETEQLEAVIGPVPTTSIRDGVSAFLDWYRSYERASDL